MTTKLSKAQTPLVRFVVDLLYNVFIRNTQEIETVEFEPW